MRRVHDTPRPGWQQTVEGQGLVYGSPGRDASGQPRPYWDESVHYEFDMPEILALEADVELLHSMCLNAVEHIVLTERFADFGLPEWSWGPIAESWKRSDPYVYGRFDLRYDARRPAKLLEYNADTPTSLLEAAIVQWHWLTDRYPGGDQWNSLHEKLVERWSALRDVLPTPQLHFTWSGADATGEDNVTTAYLQETAAEAGFDTIAL
ncbi:glutathionylspermidine synthase family protein, partial [Nocardia sp. 2TAF39]